MVSDIPVLLDDTLVFISDFVINNLQVDLVALRSEAVHNRVVGCNAILVLIGIKGGRQVLCWSNNGRWSGYIYYRCEI